MSGTRISAAMCGAGRSLAQSRVSPDGRWVAFVATGGAKPRIVTVPVEGGAESIVTSDPPCSGAHPHGGGVFDWAAGGAAIVYVGIDGSVYMVPSSGGISTLIYESDSACAPSVSPGGDKVVFTVDDRTIVTCDLNLAGDPTAAVVGVRKIAADFAIDPFWLDTGNHVSWIEWDIPNMPWMASRLVSARADGTGPVDNIVSSESTSVSQASLSPDGTHLAFICDQTGWPVVWVADADGSNSRPLCDTEGVEHSEPTWGPGQRSWCWSPDSRSIAFGRNAGGFWSLHVATIDEAEGAALPRQIGNGFHAGVNWSASGIISLSSPHGIVKMAGNHEGMISSMPLIDPLNCKVLARGLVGGFEPSMMGNCEAVSWNSKGKDIHGRLYRGAIERDEENPSPVLIWIHGGPMGQMGDLFNPRIAFFLERGWSVLVPDFRGSSGWGRDYSAGLDEMWGVADVDDVAAGMEYVAKTDWADRQLMVPIGASSGGTCVLLLMARYPQLCAAGIDLYGVTDFLDLTLHTHRFEKHYNESLIGALPGSEQRYRDRSPISQAQNICSPILVLHGDRDKVVPIEQSVELVSTIRESGGQVSFHVYEGQGHGWSDPSTVADELARIEEFLESVR